MIQQYPIGQKDINGLEIKEFDVIQDIIEGYYSVVYENASGKFVGGLGFILPNTFKPMVEYDNPYSGEKRVVDNIFNPKINKVTKEQIFYND